MKIKAILSGIVCLSMLASCSEDLLETSPTQAISGETLLSSPTNAQMALNGVYREMFTAGWSTSGNTHQCFGVSAYTVMGEVMGEDMIMSAMGSGWFWYDCLYNVKSRYTSQSWRSYDLWNAYYNWISNVNTLIGMMKDAGDQVRYALGQAYAIRAYSYFMLAQNFARTYVGHESEPCVPIYTEPTTPATKGQPRSTVAQVYQQIDDDLAEALRLLEGQGQDDPSHFGYAVASGIKARVALVENKWADARDAAINAIAASGCRILPVSSFMGMNDATASNVMWGSIIITDQVGAYASLFSHMDADAGAYGTTARKMINRELYAKMGPADTRRAWWDVENENNVDAEGNNLGYQQEKFKFSDIQSWMGDYIYMRVEEMYLIAAEAECRLGNETDAIGYLYALMSNRDPEYSTEKSGTALGATSSDLTGSLLEEILIQRRIELWGESDRVHDLKRCKQGFVRTAEMGWPADARLENRPTADPESYMNVFTIPQSEFDGNDSLNATTDQNPVGDYK